MDIIVLEEEEIVCESEAGDFLLPRFLLSLEWTGDGIRVRPGQH